MVHMTLLAALASLTLAVAIPNRSDHIEVSLGAQDSATQVPQEFHFSSEPQSQIGALGAA